MAVIAQNNDEGRARLSLRMIRSLLMKNIKKNTLPALFPIRRGYGSRGVINDLHVQPGPVPPDASDFDFFYLTNLPKNSDRRNCCQSPLVSKRCILKYTFPISVPTVLIRGRENPG